MPAAPPKLRHTTPKGRRSLALLPPAILATVLTAALLTGCATPGYRTDRWRDAKDILTCTGGWGIGAKIRGGPLTIAPLLFFNDAKGIRGGTTFTSLKGAPAPVDYGVEDGGFLFFVCDFFAVKGWRPGTTTVWEDRKDIEQARRRGKAFETYEWSVPFLNLPRLHPTYGEPYEHYPFYYFTQLEACIACGPGIRVGVNPGELVDFLLGFTTIDVLNDDTGAPENSPSETPSP